MQMDTVVGIVGAVVLVGVMVGVFAYEYNNDGGDVDGGGDGPGMAAFNETYPGLLAVDDLDGDGTPNYMDGDLDGDGTANDADHDVIVTAQVSGTVAAAQGSVSTDSQTFMLGEGATNIDLTLTYERPAPLPGAVGQQPRLNFRILDPEGVEVARGAESDSAGSATSTVTFEIGSPSLLSGVWTIEATSNNQVSTAISYAGDLSLTYLPPAHA